MKYAVCLLFAAGLAAAPSEPVIYPIPQEMELTAADFPLDEQVRFALPSVPSSNDVFIAGVLTSELSDRYGLAIRTGPVSRLPGSGRVIVAGAYTNPLVKQLCAQRGIVVSAGNPGPEGYVLHVDAGVVLIAGSDERGAFYGVQSLRQMIVRGAAGLYIRGAKIRDWPYKPFRGVKLYLPGRDNIAFFKRFVRDFMALYKYNQLVIELNAAMRLDRHPELNAGWIEFARDLVFSRRDRPTGPHQEYQNSAHHDTGDGGVLEKDEVAELVRWARQHYIEVIPELPSLTHAYYLLTRHRELAEIQEDEWPDAYCPSNPASYKLLFDVFDEYIEVMKPRMMHVGHDEWRAPVGVCPRCRGKDYRELFADDINRIHAYLAAKKIGMAIWGDHLLEGVRGKAVFDRVSPTGYKHQWPGGLTPEQVKQKIPKDILISNWFWSEGKAGEAESYQEQLEGWGFRQAFGNFTPSFRDWGRRSAPARIIGGAPSSWSATTEFNFGKDLMYDFLGCANLLWSKHWPEPRELTGIVQARMPAIRVRLGGAAPPSADSEPAVPIDLAPGQTKAIPVGEDASSLIFLHASDKAAVNDWTHRYIYNFEDTADLLGHYEVLYEDGFVATIPIRYGVNILERTWGERRNPRSYCYRADPVESDAGTYFSFEWVNPRLGKVIKQVSFTPSSGFRGTNRRVIPDNQVLLKALSYVKKRTSPEPGKARNFEGTP